MAILALEGIHRSYQPGRDVLAGIDLHVDEGDVLGLVGRSGAGKTTLLRVATGLLKADRGEVRVFGMDPWQSPVEVKRRFGYVAEAQMVPRHLSVRALIEVHRELYPTWDRDVERALLERLAIPTTSRIAELSKGEARKVLLLCAIAHRPELLILDEPAAGLDPAARRDFLELAIELLSEGGTTILFSSHHMTDVERIANRLVVLEQGDKVVDAELASFQQEHCVAVIPTPAPPLSEQIRAVSGFVRGSSRGTSLYAVFRREPRDLRQELSEHLRLDDVNCQRTSLEETFVALVGADS